ncbi:hypothetical protein F4679DRAFT_594413 [Xylaria curta]|nr:hypothetical protein F4679DRAFT_594413 [Xylaria curta]
MGKAKKTSRLERDIGPKPTKVQLETSADTGVSAYVPSGKLKGKRALITGGDSGIGRAVSVMFAMEGARLAIVYLPHEEEDAQHTKTQVEKNGGDVLLIPKHLSQAVNTKAIDILVNNAATRRKHASIEEITDKRGVVINGASMDSYIGVQGRLDYTTSKGAVIAFTIGLSNALMKKGIRVGAVVEGPLWIPLVATGVSKEGQHSHGFGNWTPMTPMNRLAQLSELATGYVWLAAGDSEFMSGQTLHPDRGIVING